MNLIIRRTLFWSVAVRLKCVIIPVLVYEWVHISRRLVCRCAVLGLKCVTPEKRISESIKVNAENRRIIFGIVVVIVFWFSVSKLVVRADCVVLCFSFRRFLEQYLL